MASTSDGGRTWRRPPRWFPIEFTSDTNDDYDHDDDRQRAGGFASSSGRASDGNASGHCPAFGQRMPKVETPGTNGFKIFTSLPPPAELSPSSTRCRRSCCHLPEVLILVPASGSVETLERIIVNELWWWWWWWSELKSLRPLELDGKLMIVARVELCSSLPYFKPLTKPPNRASSSRPQPMEWFQVETSWQTIRAPRYLLSSSTQTPFAYNSRQLYTSQLTTLRCCPMLLASLPKLELQFKEEPLRLRRPSSSPRFRRQLRIVWPLERNLAKCHELFERNVSRQMFTSQLRSIGPAPSQVINQCKLRCSATEVAPVGRANWRTRETPTLITVSHWRAPSQPVGWLCAGKFTQATRLICIHLFVVGQCLARRRQHKAQDQVTTITANYVQTIKFDPTGTSDRQQQDKGANATQPPPLPTRNVEQLERLDRIDTLIGDNESDLQLDNGPVSWWSRPSLPMEPNSWRHSSRMASERVSQLNQFNIIGRKSPSSLPLPDGRRNGSALVWSNPNRTGPSEAMQMLARKCLSLVVLTLTLLQQLHAHQHSPFGDLSHKFSTTTTTTTTTNDRQRLKWARRALSGFCFIVGVACRCASEIGSSASGRKVYIFAAIVLEPVKWHELGNNNDQCQRARELIKLEPQFQPANKRRRDESHGPHSNCPFECSCLGWAHSKLGPFQRPVGSLSAKSPRNSQAKRPRPFWANSCCCCCCCALAHHFSAKRLVELLTMLTSTVLECFTVLSTLSRRRNTIRPPSPSATLASGRQDSPSKPDQTSRHLDSMSPTPILTPLLIMMMILILAGDRSPSRVTASSDHLSGFKVAPDDGGGGGQSIIWPAEVRPVATSSNNSAPDLSNRWAGEWKQKSLLLEQLRSHELVNFNISTDPLEQQTNASWRFVPEPAMGFESNQSAGSQLERRTFETTRTMAEKPFGLLQTRQEFGWSRGRIDKINLKRPKLAHDNKRRWPSGRAHGFGGRKRPVSRRSRELLWGERKKWFRRRRSRERIARNQFNCSSLGFGACSGEGTAQLDDQRSRGQVEQSNGHIYLEHVAHSRETSPIFDTGQLDKRPTHSSWSHRAPPTATNNTEDQVRDHDHGKLLEDDHRFRAVSLAHRPEVSNRKLTEGGRRHAGHELGWPAPVSINALGGQEAAKPIGRTRIIAKRAPNSTRDQRLSVQLRQQSSRLLSAMAAAGTGSSPFANQVGVGRGIDCPSEWCLCTWKNGKQFADCSQSHNSQRLTTIPSGLDPLLQVLNMSGNPLGQLSSSAFNSLHLNNLQRVFLSGCRLAQVDQRAFENLKLVVELDFSWNQLKFVPLPQTRHLRLLRRLSLRGNPLMRLDEISLRGGLAANKSQGQSGGGSSTFSAAASGQLRALLSRLHETFPELALALIRTNDEGNRANRELVEMLIQLVNEHSDQTNRHRSNDNLNDRYYFGQHQGQEVPSDLRVPDLASQTATSPSDELEEPIGLEAKGSNGDRKFEFNNSIPTGEANDQMVESFGVFEQLQELDLGQCQLTYIKWSTMRNLRSLKRLQLDGNQLSQLSGLLVANLPIGLHQLSLDGNRWKCDCRLRSLKSWLLVTQTPLSAPVECSRRAHRATMATGRRRDLNDRKQQNGPNYISRLEDKSRPSSDTSTGPNGRPEPAAMLPIEFLDQLDLEDFVCAPKAYHRADQFDGPIDKSFAKADEQTTNTPVAELAPSRLLTATVTNLKGARRRAGQTGDGEKLAADDDEIKLRSNTRVQLDDGLDEHDGDQDQDRDEVRDNEAKGDLERARDRYQAQQPDELAQGQQPLWSDWGPRQPLELGPLVLQYLGAKLVNRQDHYVGLHQATWRPPGASKQIKSSKHSDDQQRDQGDQRTSGDNKSDGGVRNETLPAGGDTLQTEPVRRRRRVQIVQAIEDEPIVLRCAFVAYPSSSADIIWLADYSATDRSGNQINHPKEQLGREQNFVLLYDSALHQTQSAPKFDDGDRQQQQQQQDKSQTTSNEIRPPADSLQESDAATLDEPNPSRSQEAEFSLDVSGRVFVRDTPTRQPPPTLTVPLETSLSLSAPTTTTSGLGHTHDATTLILRESQLIVRAARGTDSARYKCTGLNRAGSDSHEFIVSVRQRHQFTSIGRTPEHGLGFTSGHRTGSSPEPTHLEQSDENDDETEPGQTRDQRANGSSELAIGQADSQAVGNVAGRRYRQQQRQQLVREQQEKLERGQRQRASGWLRGSGVSASFQIVVIVVSVLLGAVILAFLLVCIIIYQIKPQFLSSPTTNSIQGNINNNTNLDETALSPYENGSAPLIGTQTDTATASVNAMQHETSAVSSGQRQMIASNHLPIQVAWFCAPNASQVRGQNDAEFGFYRTADKLTQSPALIGANATNLSPNPLVKTTCDPNTGRVLQSRLEWASQTAYGHNNSLSTPEITSATSNSSSTLETNGQLAEHLAVFDSHQMASNRLVQVSGTRFGRDLELLKTTEICL